MGADGHIAYFDADMVDKIQEEIKLKYPTQQIDHRESGCNYTVNGKRVYLSYWGDNADWCGWGAEGSLLSDYENNNEATQEFAKRVSQEAIVVADHEVWT
jgi:hypothetical protein